MVIKYIIAINSLIIYFVCAVTNDPTKVAALTIDNNSIQSSASSSMINTKDLLKREESSRFNDPAPEYYKGRPASNSILDRERDRDRYIGFSSSSRPDPIEHRYGGFTTSNFGNTRNTYESRYPPTSQSSLLPPLIPTSSYSITNRDRINYGHYGTTGFGNYDHTRPSLIPPHLPPPSPYGQPQPIDLPGGYHHGFTSYEINDNNNNNNNNLGNGLDWGHNGYGQNHWGSNGFQLTKANLLPIAGAVLLGIAAALVANPVLLQLGVLPGKRRKRDINGQKLAYKGYNQNDDKTKSDKI